MDVHALLSTLSTDYNYAATVGVRVGDRIYEIDSVEVNEFDGDEIVTIVAVSDEV